MRRQDPAMVVVAQLRASWAAHQGALWTKTFILKHDWAKKTKEPPRVLVCYCMAWKREFLLQKEA